MLRRFGPLAALALLACADDLSDEDAFLDDRRDDEVIDPPRGALPSCEPLDGTFVADDLVVLGTDGERAELEEGTLTLTFDDAAGTFTSARDEGDPTAGDFATFADRLLLSAPLFDAVTAPGVLDCAVTDDQLRLVGPILFRFPNAPTDQGAEARLYATFLRVP